MRTDRFFMVLAAASWLGLLSGCQGPTGKVQAFNGHDLAGWRLLADNPTEQGWWCVGRAEVDLDDQTRLRVRPGTGELVNALPKTGRGVNLCSTAIFGDSHVELELMIPHKSNSGIYVMGEYEIQILDSYGTATAELRMSDMGAVYGAALPKVNACKKPGEWQKFVIEYRAPRFNAKGNKIQNARLVKVELNGQLIHQDLELTGPTPSGISGKESPRGPLMFQGDHGPVALRNITVTPMP